MLDAIEWLGQPPVDTTSTAQNAIDLLKALVEEKLEGCICLNPLANALVNPQCLRHYCGDCVKESIKKCNNLRADEQFDEIVSSPIICTNSNHFCCAHQPMTSIIILQVQSVLDAIASLEQHLQCSQIRKRDADGVQSNANEDIGCVLSTATTQAEEVGMGSKRAREAPSSIQQSLVRSSPLEESAGSVQTRTNKRVKRAPLPTIAQAQQGSAPRRLPMRGNGDLPKSTENLAHASSRRSARKRNTSSSSNHKQPDNEGIEEAEETDYILPTIDHQGSALGDDNDQGDGGGKRITANPVPKSFDERFEELMVFKEKHGHCRAPKTPSSEYFALGRWCGELRTSYKQIQRGQNPQVKLSIVNIQRLEEEGFKWTLGPRIQSFDERFAALLGFKEKFHHCNVPMKKSSEYSSLGQWCHDVRQSYRKTQKGPTRLISDENIQRLEEQGFKWKMCQTFDEHFEELMKFKRKNGHCRAPKTPSSEYYALGRWCGDVRSSYKQIQRGQTPQIRLSTSNIQRLEEADFKWSLGPELQTFDERFEALLAFKEEFGHCDVPRRTKSSGYSSLGQWCHDMRQSYRRTLDGKKSKRFLSVDHIQRLEKEGFKWTLS